MAPKVVKFLDGERILCFHGPLMYEAKCIKAELRDSGKGFYYLIHYNGWNKHWDEWVPESRVLKFNETNLQKQKDLLKQHGKDKTKRTKPSKVSKNDNGKDVTEKPKKAESSTSLLEPKKKRSKIETSFTAEQLPISSNKARASINIPDAIKPILVDDWDLVTKQKQLFQLPAKHTIETILSTYIEKNSAGSSIERLSSLEELVAGIKEYFNVMLGTQLLYKCERLQFNEILMKYPDLNMAQIYGIPHLLRFFVKIDTALSFTNLDERNLVVLNFHLQSCVDYLQENLSSFFNKDEYQPADISKY